MRFRLINIWSDNMSFAQDPWLTEKEAAAELRVSQYFVRAERVAGRLGYARIRRRVFYPMSQINDYKDRALRPAKGCDPVSLIVTSVRRGASPAELGRQAARRAKAKGLLRGD